jgi:hypothetical protein
MKGLVESVHVRGYFCMVSNREMRDFGSLLAQDNDNEHGQRNDTPIYSRINTSIPLVLKTQRQLYGLLDLLKNN